MEDRINKKYLYKVFLIVLKVIPYLLAVCSIIYTFGNYWGVSLDVIGYFASCSIITWIFLYLSTFVFGFCSYHRIPLYYILSADILNVVDLYVGLPVDTHGLFLIYFVLLGVMALLYVYLMVKKKKRHAQ